MKEVGTREGKMGPAETAQQPRLQLLAPRYAACVPLTDSLQDRFEAAVEHDDPFELQRVILEVAHEAENREWAEVCCARLTRHRNANVRGNALHGLGHLARRFGQLDRRRVQRLIEIGLHAHNEVVRAGAESAAQDAETYLAWSFERARE